jgi:hypothetical protein
MSAAPGSISLLTFKDRFTTGELVDISATYAGGCLYSHCSMGSVELDNALVGSMDYSTTKSIISIDRPKNILNEHLKVIRKIQILRTTGNNRS